MRPSLMRKDWFSAVSILTAASLIGTDLTGVVWGARALAQTAPQRRLALFVVPKTPKDEKAALILKGLFRTTADRLEDAGIGRALPGSDRAAVETARARVEEGRKALNANRWAEALSAFQAAEAALAKAPGLADRTLIGRIYKGIGVAFAALSRPEEARRAMHRSLAVYPNQDASSYAYVLESRNLFSQVLREVQDLPNGALVITTVPPMAEVYVDFEFKGFSPVRVAGLTAGDHLVRVFLDGYHPQDAFVRVQGGADDEATLALSPAPNQNEIRTRLAEAGKALDRRRPVEEAASGLVQAMDATDVLYLRVAGAATGFAVSGFHRGPAGVRAIETTIARDATLVQSAQGLLTESVGVGMPPEAALPPLDAPQVALPAPATGVVAAPPAEGEEYIIDPNSPIFKDTKRKPETGGIVTKWWFWTAIGVVVGGAVALGVTLGRRSSSSATPEGRIEVLLHQAP